MTEIPGGEKSGDQGFDESRQEGLRRSLEDIRQNINTLLIAVQSELAEIQTVFDVKRKAFPSLGSLDQQEQAARALLLTENEWKTAVETLKSGIGRSMSELHKLLDEYQEDLPLKKIIYDYIRILAEPRPPILSKGQVKKIVSELRTEFSKELSEPAK